jgi:hypothetical protein
MRHGDGDQAVNALGVSYRKFPGEDGAPIVPDQMRPLDAHCIEDREHVLHEDRERIVANSGGLVRFTPASKIGSNRAEAGTL